MKCVIEIRLDKTSPQMNKWPTECLTEPHSRKPQFRRAHQVDSPYLNTATHTHLYKKHTNTNICPCTTLGLVTLPAQLAKESTRFFLFGGSSWKIEAFNMRKKLQIVFTKDFICLKGTFHEKTYCE